MAKEAIQFPENGLNELEAFSDQPPLTTKEGRNVRFTNRKNGRRCGSQRAGSKLWLAGTPNGGAKISRIESVIYARKKMTYAALADGSHTIEGEIASPSLTDCPAICVDLDGNVYFMDGPSGVVKINPDLRQVWKLSIPIQDKLGSCRALWVDDFGGVYFGVSSGGDSTKARLWKYQQDELDKTSKLWEIDTLMFIEQIVRVDALLYTLQNDPLTRQTFVVAYSRVDGAAPEEEWRTEVSYPGNGLAISPTDHSVYFASEPSANRGFNPRSPLTSVRQVDWTPDQLYKAKQRIWSWHNCDSLDNLNISNAAGDNPDGNEVLVWYDSSGNGRHWYANAKLAPSSSSSGSADHGPTYRANSIGNRPGLRFNGVGGTAAAPGSGQSMYTIVPTSDDRAYRHEQLSAFPTYKGAQWICVAVVRYSINGTSCGLFSIEDAVSADVSLILNRRAMDIAGATSIFPGTAHVLEVGAASDAASTSPAAAGPSGVNNTPAAGPCGPYGHAILTWIHDGGTHDVFGTATRSQFRINGNPVDRWQSPRGSFLGPCLLGYPFGTNFTTGVMPNRFAGEICEMIVLSDWDDENGALQRLANTFSIGADTYGIGAATTGACNTFPDTNVAGMVSGQSDPDGDVERLEGYVARKFGLSHLLPAGFSATVSNQASNNFTAGNTATVAGLVYTWSAAPAAQRDVLIGATPQASLLNLCSCINATGEIGVDYYYNNVANPTVFALAPIETVNGTTYSMRVVARDPLAAAFTLSVAQGGGTAGRQGAATAVANRTDGAGKNVGWHPHAYAIKHTSECGGGPPKYDSAPGTSNFADLISPYGILGKLDAGGALTWVMTSNRQNNATGYGGVGYGVACNSVGEVYSVGPRQALVTNPPITADAFDYRKAVDTGSGFKPMAGGTALTDPWRFAASDQLYHYPRLAVDKFDNVYFPIQDTPETVSLRAFQRQPDAGATSLGIALLTVNNITDDPQCFAVAIDPRVPTYETDLSDSSNPIQARAQFAYLASRKETGTNLNVLHKIGFVSSTPSSGSPRARVDLVASGTALKSFTQGGSFTSIASPFAATADFIDSVAIFEKVVWTDGANLFVYDPKKNVVARLKAKASGQIPQGCQLLGLFNGRLMAARDKSNPHRWYASEQGDTEGWDFGAPLSATMAVSHADPRIGPVPDIINCLFKVSDDRFGFGCQNSIWMLLGDPAARNARLMVVPGSDCGMAFGRSCASDGDGNIYFVGARGGFYAWLNGAIKCLSDDCIPRRMRDLDFGSNWIELVWDPRENAMRVYVCPFGAGGSQRLAYSWERRTGAIIPWEDSYGTASDFSRQPTCARLIQGDTAAERVLLYGTEDGHILAYDEASAADDTVPIDSYALIQVTPKGPGKDFMFRRLKLALAQDDGPCNFEFYGSRTAEQLGTVRASGLLQPGPNPTRLVRVRNRNVWLRLRSAGSTSWAFEEGSIEAEMVGTARVQR